MAEIYISIGSNIGDRLAALNLAIEKIAALDDVKVLGRGRVYETEPQGRRGQPWFYNTAILVESGREPEDILAELMEIEREMGRVREGKWSPREIDLDIIFYGSLKVEKPGLSIPHPLAHLRRFVLLPIADINPGAVHPAFGKTVAEMLAVVPESGQLTRELE